MARIPLVFPMGGRLDSRAHSDHPELYTRSARNVCARDPVTGKLRGAQRPGLSKWNPNLIGSTRIKALASTAIDDRKLEYTFSAGTESVLWDETTPSKSDCLDGKTDAFGNVYALDGNAGIVKMNSAGREVMKIALPVADPNHIVRALWVDESGRIFAGVSAGGDVLTASIWCILQLEDSQYFILWTLTPGAYTEELRVYRGSQLYAAHNYPQENRARVLIYENIGLDPVETKRVESLAYPINGMDVLDGALYCTSPDNLGDVHTASAGVDEQYRPGHPTQRGFHAPLVAWTPWQLDNARRRIHAWYDAADIDTTDLEQAGDIPTLDEGQQVLRWRDRSGNNRHWYSGVLATAGEAGPTYAKVGPGGLPAVRFQNVGMVKQSLVTEQNASITKNTADQQRTAIPAHEGAMWAMFILLRPQVDDVVGTDPRVVFYAENDATVGTPGPHGLWINRACGATQPGTFAATALSYFAKTDAADDGACATADQAAGYTYTNSPTRFTDTVLVTVLWDGAIDSAGGTTKTRCLFRVNGHPIDRFTGLAFQSLKANYLGYAPTVATAVANRFNGEICEMLVVGRRDRFDDTTEPKVLTHDLIDFNEDFPAGLDQTDHELARIESYMMHRRGIGHALGATALWAHFYGTGDPTVAGSSSPPDYDGAGRSTALEELLKRYPLATKHDDQGRLLWVCNESTHPDTGANRGDIGYGVRARKIESDGKVHVWMVGPDAVQATTGDVAVRKVIDLGASFSGAQADGAWRHKFTSNRTYDYLYPRMAADEFGNLYLPYFETGAAAEWSLLAFKKDPDGGGLAQVLVDFLLPASQQAHAVAVPHDSLNPDYRTDLATKMAEHVYIFTRNESVAANPTVHKLRLVTSNPLASGSPRSVHTIAVVEDDIRLVTAASSAIPTGGSAVIDATSQYIQAFRAGDDIVILDGKNYFAYKIRDGTVEPLVSTSAGEIPPRAQLAMYWRHRLVLGRFADKAGNYAASKLGDIRNWNQRPGSLPTGEQIQTSTQAFSGAGTRAGEAEDSIVALIPVWDDLAFIVCESRILRLTGDPQDGGNIHKVTDSMGGVFGDSWCKDQSGRVFMFGNAPPGLYMLQAEGDPVPLSRHTLEESEFADIDFAEHRIVLAWNPIRRGVHIWRVAWSTSTVVDHWFWEEKTHRFVRQPPIWTERYGLAGLQPTAYAYLGGDDTRGLLVGCEDGYIRMIDPAAVSDDGTLIDSFVVFGPITPPGSTGLEYRIIEVSIELADDQSGARLEVFGGETADTLGPALWARDLQPGLNVLRVRVKAARIWLRLRGVGLKRWAYEAGHATIVATDKAQQGSEIG